MPPQVMGPELDPGDISCLFDNHPGCGIRDRKDPVISLNGPVFHVGPQSVHHLSRDEYHLGILPALWALDGELLIVHVIGGQFQDFPDSHAASGHELQDQSVSELRRSENDLIHGLLFDNVPQDGLAGPVDLPEHRGIARVLNGRIKVGPDEVEEGLEVGIAAMLRLLLSALSDLAQKR